MYRRKPAVLLLAAGLTVGVHVFTALGVYLVARGLPGTAPSLGSHFVVVPLAMVAGALPLPLSGLGAFEGALDFLYRYAPGAGGGQRRAGPAGGLRLPPGHRGDCHGGRRHLAGQPPRGGGDVARCRSGQKAGDDASESPPKETLEVARREPS